jgi:subtilisin
VGEINTRDLQYIIGRRAYPAPASQSIGSANGSGADMFDTDTLVKTLAAIPDVSVVRVVKSHGLGALASEPILSHGDIVVVRTSHPERAEYLEALAQRTPSLIVERDLLLQHLGNFRPPSPRLPRNPSQITAASSTVRFHVQDPNGQPVPDADIVVYGDSGTEDQDKTDAKGDVSITIMGGFLNDVVAVYVKPAANFWERYIERPALDELGVNTVIVRPLEEFSAAHFPGSPFLGWGQRVMRLLDLDLRQATGAGARVAIIDSGCDNTHPALRHITLGRDYTNLNTKHEPDPATWSNDVISHGTHCAGIIAGNGAAGHIRGFAPAAEVHILKVFPGGAFNNLVAAINYCIDNDIHVVNCSLGSAVGSQLVAQSIERARQAGVALFVAAGNSASAVQFPANVPGVLCVAALGQAGNVPDYTYHARTVPDGATVVTGQVYPARFSCHGPQVAACAPGVGIISSVPGGGYAAWDGTSMADPHLTGLAALLAAHHPELSKVKVRGASWVDRLMGLMVSAAQSTGVDPQYGGAGLPIVPRALGGQFTAQAAWPRLTPQQFPPDLIDELAKAVAKLLSRDMTAPLNQSNTGSETSSHSAKH